MNLYHADMRVDCANLRSATRGHRYRQARGHLRDLIVLSFGLLVFGLLAFGLLGLSWGCGGAAGPAEPEIQESQPGTVQVVNQTGWEVEVSWLQADTTGTTVGRLSVGAGMSVILGQWPADGELGLDLVLLVPPETGPRVRRKALVVVDGDQVVELRSGDDPYTVEVTVSPTASP